MNIFHIKNGEDRQWIVIAADADRAIALIPAEELKPVNMAPYPGYKPQESRVEIEEIILDMPRIVLAFYKSTPRYG